MDEGIPHRAQHQRIAGSAKEADQAGIRKCNGDDLRTTAWDQVHHGLC